MTTKVRDDETRDGETVRTPMLLMDGGNVVITIGELHRPGYRFASDGGGDGDKARDAAEVARKVWLAELREAWRTPPAQAVDDTARKPSLPATSKGGDDRAAAYQEMLDHLTGKSP